MASTIILKHGTGSAIATSLQQGEFAINVDSGSLYYGVKGGGAVSSSFYIGNLTASGDISASGTGSFDGGIEAQNATGSFGYLSASGDITAAGTIFATNMTASGTVSASTLFATNVYGTLATVAQTNVTSLGTLTSLIIDGTTDPLFRVILNEETQAITVDETARTVIHDLSVTTVRSLGTLPATTVGSDMTFNNNTDLKMKEAGGTARDMVKMTTADIGTFGNTNTATSIQGNRLSLSGSTGIDFLHPVTMSGKGGDNVAIHFAQGGLDAIEHTGSFGYISCSGDITAAGTIFTTNMTASGAVSCSTLNITSTSGNSVIIGGNMLIGSNKAIGFGGTSTKIFGDNTNLRLEGTSITITGSVSMSGAISMSGANADISTDQGAIYAGGDISSSATLLGTDLDLRAAGVVKASIDTSGNIAAEGTISSSGVMSATALTLTTAGVHKASIDASGNVAAEGYISSSGQLSGTNLEIRTAGVAKTAIDAQGGVTASNFQGTKHILRSGPFYINDNPWVQNAVYFGGTLNHTPANWNDYQDAGGTIATTNSFTIVEDDMNWGYILPFDISKIEVQCSLRPALGGGDTYTLAIYTAGRQSNDDTAITLTKVANQNATIVAARYVTNDLDYTADLDKGTMIFVGVGSSDATDAKNARGIMNIIATQR